MSRGRALFQAVPALFEHEICEGHNRAKLSVQCVTKLSSATGLIKKRNNWSSSHKIKPFGRYISEAPLVSFHSTQTRKALGVDQTHPSYCSHTPASTQTLLVAPA